MNSDSLIMEIAILRLRQRKLLQILRDRNILDWDGVIYGNDADLEPIYEEIRAKWLQDQENIGKSGQGNQPTNL